MTALFLLPLLAPLARSQDAPEGDIDALIEQLDSDDWAARERAGEELRRIGKRAENVLRRAAKEHHSVEVRARAAALLDALEGGGPTVNGLKLFLSTDRKSARPGDRIVFATRLVNRTAEPMNLYVGYSTGGPDFESGEALQTSPGGAGRWTVGCCGNGAGPLFITIPAGGEARFEAPATLEVKNGKPFLAFRWYRVDLDGACDLRLWLKHSVNAARNSDRGRGAHRHPDNNAPYWTGEIESNVITLAIELEPR